MKNEIISPSHRRLLQEIELTSRTLLHKIEETLKPFDLTPQQFNFLRILRGTNPQAQCMQEIKGKLIDRNADATRLAARLIAKNYISPADTTDKRQRALNITELGLALLTKIDQQLPQFPYSLTQGIPIEHVESCIKVLKMLRDKNLVNPEDNQ